ncbi:MAG: hypothetical protein ACYCT2_00215 [Thermoplasmataceae archaeon]
MANLPKNVPFITVAVVFALLIGVILSKALNEFIALAVVCFIPGPMVFLVGLGKSHMAVKQTPIASAFNVIFVEIIFITVTLESYSGFSDLSLIIGILPVPIMLYSILGYLLIKSRKSGADNSGYTLDRDLTSRLHDLFPDIADAKVFVSEGAGMRGIVKEIRKPATGVVFRKDALQILNQSEIDAALVEYALLARGNYAPKTLFYIFSVFSLQIDILIGSVLITPNIVSHTLQILLIVILLSTVISIALLGKILMWISHAPIRACDLQTLRIIKNPDCVKSMIRKVSENRDIPVSIMNNRYERVKRIQEKEVNRRISLVENARY